MLRGLAFLCVAYFLSTLIYLYIYIYVSLTTFHHATVFPAAILQPPFFNVNADDAVNYGAIGAGE